MRLIGEHAREMCERERRTAEHVGAGAAIDHLRLAAQNGLEHRQAICKRVALAFADRGAWPDHQRAMQSERGRAVGRG